MKFKIVELSHDDLVFFIHYALMIFHISWDNENDNLISNTSNLEERIADILVGGGEIKVSDVRAVDDYDFHNANNLRTSIEILPSYSATQLKWLSSYSIHIFGNNLKSAKVPTYYITLEDMYNGMNKEEAMSPFKDLFFYCKINKVDTLMQYILFGEVIYT